MEKLKQALNAIKGNNVIINTQHVLFGGNSARCDYFIPVIENGAGFKFVDQAIYIKYGDIDYYEIKEHEIVIKGNKLCIKIVKKC